MEILNLGMDATVPAEYKQAISVSGEATGVIAGIRILRFNGKFILIWEKTKYQSLYGVIAEIYQMFLLESIALFSIQWFRFFPIARDTRQLWNTSSQS